MVLFDDIIREIRAYIRDKESNNDARRLEPAGSGSWPPAGDRDIVLRPDLGIELGSPSDGSVSLLLWTNDPRLVNDERITLVGPDLAGSPQNHLPFAKAVLIHGRDFDEANCYERYQEMSLVPYELSLKGYMMRAASRSMQEWIRVSREALGQGLSLATVGHALLEKYKEKDYIEAVELLLVTSADDLSALQAIGTRAGQYLNAMRKMEEEMNFDCDTCEYQPVCDQVIELKKMRDLLIRVKGKK